VDDPIEEIKAPIHSLGAVTGQRNCVNYRHHPIAGRCPEGLKMHGNIIEAADPLHELGIRS